MTDAADIRLKRLTMRAGRRGTKEMDLILSAFAGRSLGTLDPADLDLFEALLEENDQDLYAWITALVTGRPAPGVADPPQALRPLLGSIAAVARAGLVPGAPPTGS